MLQREQLPHTLTSDLGSRMGKGQVSAALRPKDTHRWKLGTPHGTQGSLKGHHHQGKYAAQGCWGCSQRSRGNLQEPGHPGAAVTVNGVQALTIACQPRPRLYQCPRRPLGPRDHPEVTIHYSDSPVPHPSTVQHNPHLFLTCCCTN